MRDWLVEQEHKEHVAAYIRMDYLPVGATDEEKAKNMAAFKQALIERFVIEHVPLGFLIDEAGPYVLANMEAHLQKEAKALFNRMREKKNARNNYAGLIGEFVCAWLGITYDGEPITCSELHTGSSTTQGIDRWELHQKNGHLTLRIWSAKTTENAPSTRSYEIRTKDFGTTSIMGAIKSMERRAYKEKLDKDEIAAISKSWLKPGSRLSVGVALVVDKAKYDSVYGKGTPTDKLDLFDASLQHCERLVRIVPVADVSGILAGWADDVDAFLKGGHHHAPACPPYT